MSDIREEEMLSGSMSETTLEGMCENLRTSNTQQTLKAVDLAIPDSSRLDGASNYPVWSYRMQCVLERHQIWQYCVNPPSRLDVTVAKTEGRFLAHQAIAESVKDSEILVIRRFTDPYECWQHLCNRYMLQSGATRLMLLRRYLACKKEETTSMERFLRDVKSNIDELESMNVALPEELTVLLLLGSLPKEYQVFTKALSGKDRLPSFCELESKLLDEELQVKMDVEKEAGSEALYLNRGSSSSYS